MPFRNHAAALSTAPHPPPGGSSRWLSWFNLALLAGGTLVVGAVLWPQWLHNPDLAHGLFMPAVFPLLLYESRRSRSDGHGPAGGTRTAIVAVLSAAGLAALSAAGLYASVLGWSHSVVLFLLTTALASTLGAALAAFSAEGGGLAPINWSAAVAIGLWLLCAPIPSGTYARLTIALQLWVSTSVLGTLHLLGIAAARHGNIIELAHTMVGIEEACSGVRSLLSCVFAGLFFSATVVRRPGARILIVALSVPLALVMNFIRSLALTLMANDGIKVDGTWHDATGYAVFGATAALLGGLALRMGRRDQSASRPPEPDASRMETPSSRSQWILASALAAGAALGALFLANGLARPPAAGPAPDLGALLPSGSPGWRTVKEGDVGIYADVLQTNSLAERAYVKAGQRGETGIILYLAYWPAGRTAVSSVDLHTPDMCWPGAGWVLEPSPRSREFLSVGGRTLPEAEYRFLKYEGIYPENVWFWHIYGGRPIAYRNPYSPRQLLAIAWKYGFRHDGDQLFVRISSNRPWSEIANEPLLVKFLGGLEPLGL